MAKSSDDGRRVARVEKEVQEAVARYLIRDLRDELPGLVTVSRVQMPADLRSARVYISLLAPGEDEAALMDQAADILQAWAPEIQERLNRELKLRFCPKLEFFADETWDRVLKVESLLHEVSQERAKKKPEGT